MDPCLQGNYLLALKAVLVRASVLLHELVEVDSPLGYPHEQGLGLPSFFSEPLKLPQISCCDTPVEPEAAHSVHAVYHPALPRAVSNSEHVLVDHGHRLEDALGEFLPIAFHCSEDL